MKLLEVTYGLPFPLAEGGKIRDHQLLRAMSAEAEVHVLCFCKDDPSPPGLGPLPGFCASLETFPVTRPRAAAALPAHVLAGRPVATFPFYYPEFAARIAELAARHQVDVVQIEHSFLAPYLTSAPARCVRVLSLHNIGERQYASIARMNRTSPMDWLKAAAMRGWEAGWAARFDGVVTVSRQEAEWIRQRTPKPPICVIPNGVECGALQPLPEPEAPNDLLFIGTLGYPPNADAVRWLVREIVPLIHRHAPQARLIVVGRSPGDDLRALAAEGAFELHADVPDILPYYRRCAACVVPLRAGGGTRLKILEAMALGRPVVSTTVGCEGLEAVPGEHLWVADQPDEFAAHVATVLNDPVRRRAVSASARRFVEQYHDWPALGRHQLDFYRELLAVRHEKAHSAAQ